MGEERDDLVNYMPEYRVKSTSVNTILFSKILIRYDGKMKINSVTAYYTHCTKLALIG
jgi:hypothetical protein